MVSAEEEQVASVAERQSKQLFYVQPQLTPASSYPLKYFSNSPYDLMTPKQTPLIRRNPIQQQFGALNWPYNYPLLSSPGNQSIVPRLISNSLLIIHWFYTELKADREEEEDETLANWRVLDGINDIGNVKFWKNRFNRQAVITIHPAATGKIDYIIHFYFERFANAFDSSKLECLNANIGTDGLGPCKRATIAPHGTIDIQLPVTGQTAVIAITASSPVNTRVRLICTDLISVGVFTVRNWI